MTREMKNPGALAGAAGAYQRRLGKADIAGPAGTVQGRKSRKQDEPFRDAWIKAARRMVASRKTILRDADFVACGAIFELMQEDGRFFMPYERLSGPDGAGCSRSQAANMLARLRTAGLIRDAEVPLLRKKTSKPGRVSPTYQAAIPAISSSPAGELSGGISSTGVDEIGADFVQISRRNPGRAEGISSTSVDPTTYIIEDPDAWRSEVEAEAAVDVGKAVRSCAPTPPAPDLADGAPGVDASCIVDEKIADLEDAAWHQAQAEARVGAPPRPQVVSRGPDVQRQDPGTGRAERDPRATAALRDVENALACLSPRSPFPHPAAAVAHAFIVAHCLGRGHDPSLPATAAAMALLLSSGGTSRKSAAAVAWQGLAASLGKYAHVHGISGEVIRGAHARHSAACRAELEEHRQEAGARYVQKI